MKGMKTVYFSPTGGTERIARIFSDELFRSLSVGKEKNGEAFSQELFRSLSVGKEKNGEAFSQELSRSLEMMGRGREAGGEEDSLRYFDVTRPGEREEGFHFSNDLVVAVMPTYAGRLPNKILPDLKRVLKSDGSSFAVAIAVFGNRSPGDAPKELALLLKENGFKVVGMGAFVSRHAFSDKVGEGRPDEEDEKAIKAFAVELSDKLFGADWSSEQEYEMDEQSISSEDMVSRPLSKKGGEGLEIELNHSELLPYYTPLKEDLTPASFLKAKPVLDSEKCIGCGICKISCPVGSIDATTLDEGENQEKQSNQGNQNNHGNQGKTVFETPGICIKCQACIRKCPVSARTFQDEEFLSHIKMLEENYSQQRSSEQFYLI